jgi:hypothetical protein
MGFFQKLLYLFINPARAFWDINHLRKESPGYIILLFNSLAYGLLGMAIFSHIYLQQLVRNIIFSFMGFLSFFLFGFIFQYFLYVFLIWLFGRGANYSVNFSERLEQRFGGESIEKKQYEERKLSPFSIYKGGTLLQTQKPYKYKMMMCAFAPFLVINLLNALILWIGLPDVTVSSSSQIDETFLTLLSPSSPVWVAVHVIEFITVSFWVPILITIAIRELSNSSTLRVLISSLIIGILVGIFFYLLRPTLLGY